MHAPPHYEEIVIRFAYPLLALLALAIAPAWADECNKIHADLVEVAATEGCQPGLTSCFLGEVDGNHGLRLPVI